MSLDDVLALIGLLVASGVGIVAGTLAVFAVMDWWVG